MDAQQLVDFMSETAVRFAYAQAQDGIRRSVHGTSTSLCFFYSASPHHQKYEFLPFDHLLNGSPAGCRILRDQSIARLERAIRYVRGRQPDNDQPQE